MKTDANSYWSYLIEVAMGLRTGKLGKIAAAEQIEALAARMNADRSGGPDCISVPLEPTKEMIAAGDNAANGWRLQLYEEEIVATYKAMVRASPFATSVTSEEKA
jgi:hypothetical protein